MCQNSRPPFPLIWSSPSPYFLIFPIQIPHICSQHFLSYFLSPFSPFFQNNWSTPPAEQIFPISPKFAFLQNFLHHFYKNMPFGMFILFLLIFLLKWICQAEFSDSNEENIEEECSTTEDHDQSASSFPHSAFLWSIDASWRRAPSFMFGTIHVPFDRIWPNVPNSVKEAFDSADSIVFELALEKSETVEQLIKCKQLAPGNGSLRDHLPIELFHRIKAYMHRLRHRILRLGYQEHRSRSAARRQMRRLFPNDWEYRRPVWLLFLLFQLGDSPPKPQQKPTSPMLDLFLAQMASERGKTLLSMETVEEQCNPLKSVNAQQIIFAINYSLGYLEWIEAKGQGGNQQMIEGKSPIDKLVQHYRCGTLGNGLKQIIFGAHRFAQNGFTTSPEEDQLARKVDNLLVEDILFRRNERMARRVDALMREQPDKVFFFALGAGHFLGQQSLIDQLQQMGHWVAPIVETPNSNVQYLNFDAKLPSNNPPKSILLFPASRVANMALPKIGIRLRELATFNSATNSMQNYWHPTMMAASFLSFILGTFCCFSFFHCCNLS